MRLRVVQLPTQDLPSGDTVRPYLLVFDRVDTRAVEEAARALADGGEKNPACHGVFVLTEELDVE